MKPVPPLAKTPDRSAPAGGPGAGRSGGPGGVGVVPPVPLVRQAAAPRQWSPKALAAAVLLVLLGGLVVLLALPRYAQRQDVVVAARTVSAGQVLTAQDLSTAKVAAGPDVSTVPAGQVSTVIGKIARSELAPGVVLSPALVAEGNGFVEGQALVGLALKPGQLPSSGIGVGQRVQVVGTPGATAASGQAGVWASAAFSAVVISLGAKDAATGMTVLDVRVPVADAPKVARLASTGNLAVLALPVGE